MILKQLNNNTYALRLEIDEEIITSLETIMIQQQWGFCQIQGIGAIKETTIGYFDVKEKDYNWTIKTGELELTSAIGSIAWNEADVNQPLVHCHITAGNEQYLTFSGHLKSALIAITGEFFINVVSDEKIFRKTTGPNLKIWNI